MAWDIHFGMHNMMNCGGFDAGFMGGCSMAWVGLVLLFFVGALLRKWGGEEIGVPFSLLWANIIGMVAYALVITFTGSFKLALVIGLVGLAAGGYLIGQFIGGSDEYSGDIS